MKRSMIWKAIFTKFFLLLETKRLFHKLLVNGVQSADPRYSLTKRQNMRNYFSVCFSNNQVKVLIAQPFCIMRKYKLNVWRRRYVREGFGRVIYPDLGHYKTNLVFLDIYICRRDHLWIRCGMENSQ
ncbi:hypothetical protein EFM1CSP_17320 [Enterococcus faecium]|nr:hypothetical protein EFM1CSP_17320 [Enterococcus faecium]